MREKGSQEEVESLCYFLLDPDTYIRLVYGKKLVHHSPPECDCKQYKVY